MPAVTRHEAKACMRAAFPTLPPQPDAKSVFLHLRELRNRW
jgi:hypothetical protein